MPLPTLRFPIASTSSLLFLGSTVSFCWTGVSCDFCVPSEGGGALEGSEVGGGLCAQATLAASAVKAASLEACRRIDCIVPPPPAGSIHPNCPDGSLTLPSYDDDYRIQVS